MLKEICITPQVFDNHNLLADLNWKDIKHLLEAIGNGGYILGLHNQEWIKTTLQNISVLESEKIKDRFVSIFKFLQDRNRIVGHPKGDINPKNEEDWLKIAYELNEIREFHTILATNKYRENILCIEELEDIYISEKFGISGSHPYIKTDEKLEKIFLPLLSYAKKVTVIDPYFDISERRYKESLKLIAKCFKERRGSKEKGSIAINCSSKISPNEEWKKILDNIFQKYGHVVTINIWEDNKKMHDRYIITNQFGIQIGSGLDIGDKESEFSVLDFSTLDKHLQKFNENSSPFTLKYSVTAAGVKKK